MLLNVLFDDKMLSREKLKVEFKCFDGKKVISRFVEGLLRVLSPSNFAEKQIVVQIERSFVPHHDCRLLLHLTHSFVTERHYIGERTGAVSLRIKTYLEVTLMPYMLWFSYL